MPYVREVPDLVADVDEGAEGGGLVVDPLEFEHSALEGLRVVVATADVDDEIVLGMLLVQVLGHILDVVAISLLQDSVGRESHGDDAWSYVG